MRRLLLAALVLSAGACAAPAPCTQALCPTRYDSYRITGWNRTMTIAAGAPVMPIVSDTSVDVLGGPAQFVNGVSTLTAAAGTTFSFSVSTRAVPSITVTAGAMTVAVATGPAVNVPLGAPYLLGPAN